MVTRDVDHNRLFETAPLPCIVLEVQDDQGFVVSDVNKAAKNFFVFLHNDKSLNLNGSSFETLIPHPGRNAFMATLSRVKETGHAALVDWPMEMPDGTTILGFNAIPFHSGAKQASRIELVAIPDAEESDVLLKESGDAASLLASIFDVSEVGIIVTDRDFTVVRVNESFLRSYGWSRDDLLGKSFLHMVSEDEREQARKNHDEFMKSGIRSSGEVKILRKDGQVANALFTTSALELSGSRRFQVTTVMDITLRKHMEESLRKAKEEADAANHSKSAFLANMSHELRTPLNAIIGFSEMMLKETFGKLGNKRYKEYMGDIHLSAVHLLDIINEVLDMSKIEAGRVELDEGYINVGDLIEAVSRMMASRAFSSGLKIEEKIDKDIPALYGDPRLVRQILINLVGNAVKYAKPSTAITITAGRQPDGGLELTVSDEGVGIPRDRLEEALAPFGQVNAPGHVNISQGTGLGLPLAKAMAELHDGKLTIDSDLGKGTTVTVLFPASRMKGYKKSGRRSPFAGFKKQKPEADLAQSAE